VEFWLAVRHSPSDGAVTIRPKRAAVLGALGALTLLAAGGLLVGLGSDADPPAGGHPGETATGDTTRVRAAAPDPAAKGGESDASAMTPATTPVEPRRLRIPSLGIDAPVLPITADGLQLVPPSDSQAVGWWSAGAQPGAERGTAILTGHTVSTGGGVFDDLEHLRPGQRVKILSSGPRLRLRVSSVTTYDKGSLAEQAADIFDQTAPGRVALVTCEDWNGAAYLSNVVVIAAPVS
jgi:LPXTG-site transpeptidase (sortase) family protein